MILSNYFFKQRFTYINEYFIDLNYDFSEEDELLEPVPKQERVRLIPREFSCKRIEGTNCTFTSRVEAIFREHILTHVTEKLKKEGLLDNN